MGCEMSWGMLLVGLGVPAKSQQSLCPFHPFPSPGVGSAVVGGDGGASDARVLFALWHCPCWPSGHRERGSSSGQRQCRASRSDRFGHGWHQDGDLL